jgi:hypothetical protein
LPDDLTLRLGAEVESAVSSLQKVESRLVSILNTAKASPVIYDAYGRAAGGAVGQTDAFGGAAAGADKKTKSLGEQLLGAKSAGAVFEGQMSKIVGAFSLATLLEKGVGALITWTRELYAGADAMVAEYEATGISIERQQQWQAVAKKSHVEASIFTDASKKLGLALEAIARGGGKDANAALGELGFTYDQLKDKSPEDRLHLVITALGEQADVSKRTYLATELLTRGVADGISPALSKYKTTLSEVTVQSESEVRALHRQSEEFDRMLDRLNQYFKSAAGWAALKLQLEHVTSGNRELREEMHSLLDSGMSLGEVYDHLTAKQRTQDVVLAGNKATTRDYNAELAKAKQRLAELDPQTLKTINAGLLLNESTEEIAKTTGVAADVIELYKDRLAAEKTASDQSATAVKKHKDALKELESATIPLDAAMKKRILDLAQLKVSESDISEALGVTSTQIKRVIDERKTQLEWETKVTDLFASIWQGQQKDAKKTAEEVAKSAIAQVHAVEEMSATISLIGKLGLERRLQEIDNAEEKELSSIAHLKATNIAFYNQQKALIEQRYAHERDLANETYNTLEERLAAQGVFTKAELDAQTQRARTLYEDMVRSGRYTYAELAAAKQKWKDAEIKANGDILTDWLGLLNTIAQGFAQLGQIGDGSFSKITSGIGTVLSGASTMGSSVRGMRTAFSALGEDGGKNLTNVASAAIGVVGAIGAAVQVATTLYKIFAGSAGRDEVKKYFADFKGGADELHAKLIAIGREDLWVKLTQQTGKNDAVQAKKNIQEVKDALDAAAKSAEATAAAFETAQEKIGNSLAGVTKQLGDQARERTEANKLLRDQQDAYDELLVSGTATDEQLTEAAKNLALAQDRVAKSTVGSQEEFDRLSRISLNTFNTLVASGIEPVEAMRRVSGSVDDLEAALVAAGLQGNTAYATLARWRELTEEQAPVLDKVGSLNDLMTMTTTLGGMNADVFKDMQAQGLAAYQQLTAAGFTEQEAQTALKPLLENIVKVHKDKGLAIDEGTQKLIAQAREHGILAAEEQSTNDVLKEGLGQIIKLLGGELPEAWRKNARAAKETSREIVDDGLDAVSDGLHTIGTQLENTDWSGWGEEFSAAAREAQEEIDAVSFGHSPGGLKEIPLQLAKSMTSLREWGGRMRDELGAAERKINAFEWMEVPPDLSARVGEMTNAGSSAGGARGGIVIEAGAIQLDGRGAFFTGPDHMRQLVRDMADGLVDELGRRGIPMAGRA